MIRRADGDKRLGAAPIAATLAARSIVMTRDLSFGDGNAKTAGMSLCSADSSPSAFAQARLVRTRWPANQSYRLGAWFNRGRGLTGRRRTRRPSPRQRY